MSIHVWNFDDVDDSEELKQLKEENAQLREIIKNAPHAEDCDISRFDVCYCFDPNNHHPECVFVKPPKCTCWKKELE